jgi:hypothetical protein
MRKKWGDLEVKLRMLALHLPQLPEDEINFLSGLIACDRGPVLKTPFLKEELRVHSNLYGVCHCHTWTLEKALKSDVWVTCVCRTTRCEPGVQVAALYLRHLSTSLSYLTTSIKLAHVLLRYDIGGFH